MSGLFRADPKNNTSVLKNIIKKRRKNATALNANMQGLDRKNHQFGQLMIQIKTILRNEHKGTVHWNDQLKDGKDRILKTSKKNISSFQKKEILDLIKTCDDKMDLLSRILNQILSLFAKEEKQQETRKNEIEKLKTSLNEFVTDTVEELNKITHEARVWKFAGGNKVGPANKKRKSENDQVEGGGLNLPDKTEKDQPALVTSLFRLYKDAGVQVKTSTKKKRKIKKE